MTLDGWRQIVVGGHCCDVFEPGHRGPRGFVLLYLHDAEQQQQAAETAPYEELCRRHGLVMVAPRASRSWWCDRIYTEFDSTQSAEAHLLNHVLPFIEGEFHARPPGIGLLGVGMGGQGALRLAYKHPQRFPVVAGVSPAIDYHALMRQGDASLWDIYEDEEQARQDTAILHVHPLNWPRHQYFCCDPNDPRWWDGADRLRMKLYSLGVPHEVDLDTSHGASRSEYNRLMAAGVARFLVERLEQESRREP